MRVEAGWTGLQGAIRGLEDMDKAGAAALSKSIRKGTNAMRKHVRAAVPRGPRAPHRVKSSGVKVRVRGKGIDTVGEVYLSKAAIPLARGQKPHEIKARRKRALKFGDAFATVVQHPGAAPNPFLEKGAQDSLPDVERELDIAGVDILNSIGKSIDADKG